MISFLWREITALIGLCFLKASFILNELFVWRSSLDFNRIDKNTFRLDLCFWAWFCFDVRISRNNHMTATKREKENLNGSSWKIFTKSWIPTLCDFVLGPIKSHFPREPGSQVSLGEGKSNLPRVLVNKLTISHDVVGRLRRLTKCCGKRVTAEKMESLVAKDGSNANGEEMTNGNHNRRDSESSPEEIGCNESPDRGCKKGKGCRERL